MEIKVKYTTNMPTIIRQDNGDWLDLAIPEKEILTAGMYREIPLGVAMQLPYGYEAYVIPRSSTFKRYGLLLANSFGLIDNSYCGNNDEWKFLAYATRDVEIPKGTRLCQFRIQRKMYCPDIIVVDDLGNKNRDGIGSTGV